MNATIEKTEDKKEAAYLARLKGAKNKKIKAWYKYESAAQYACPKGWYVHAIPSFTSNRDFYKLAAPEHNYWTEVPRNSRLHRESRFRSQTAYYIKGDQIVFGASVVRLQKFVESGRELTTEAIEYLQRHRTPQEYWNNKKNEHMERARISHELCDTSGEYGHEARQQIRRDLRAKGI